LVILGQYLLVVISIVLIISVKAQSEKTYVYMLAGQSNANKHLFLALKKKIEEKHGESGILLHARHNGNPLGNWIKGEHPNFILNKNYHTDFFSPDGTGRLQMALRKLDDANVPWEFAGLFWMQGEADIQKLSYAKSYSYRFKYLYAHLFKDLGGKKFQVCVGLIDVTDRTNAPPYSENWDEKFKLVRSKQKEACFLINDRANGDYARFVDTRKVERVRDVKPESTLWGSFVHLTVNGSRELAEKMWARLNGY